MKLIRYITLSFTDHFMKFSNIRPNICVTIKYSNPATGKGATLKRELREEINK